jgi:hypothetical protein
MGINKGQYFSVGIEVRRLCKAGLLAAALLAFLGPIGEATAQSRTITLDEEIVVEGTIQKPEAFFILPRSSLNFEDLNQREDMKARIIKSVEKTPF